MPSSSKPSKAKPPEAVTTGVFAQRANAEATTRLLSNSNLKRSKARRRAELLHRSFMIETAPPSRLGKAGPYYLAAELASGGMGTVYLALRSQGGVFSEVAVKRIHRHLSGDKSFIAMFNDEARLASSIDHPYVCRVFDFGCDDGRDYLAMEYLRGASLAQLAGAFEAQVAPRRHPAIVARILANLAEGLHAAHTLHDQFGTSLEVVHRDVSPQNLFVLCDGTVRVTDFGVARARVRQHQTDGTRLKGKLAYIAPEQLAGRAVDLRVDIWGLGVVAWELLTGRALFAAASEADLVSAVIGRVIEAPSSARPGVPSELDAIVLKALQRDPEKRFSSARELATALECFLRADAVSHADVAHWFEQLLPDVAAQNEALIRRAHAQVAADAARETDAKTAT